MSEYDAFNTTIILLFFKVIMSIYYYYYFLRFILTVETIIGSPIAEIDINDITGWRGLLMPLLCWPYPGPASEGLSVFRNKVSEENAIVHNQDFYDIYTRTRRVFFSFVIF